MRRNLLLITLLLLIVAIAALSWSFNENFDGTSVATLNNDRTNPLATVPSGAIPVGISVADAARERQKYSAVFGRKATTEGFNDPLFMPRTYDENSEPGLIKFCKERGSGEAPFNDPTFASNCGVCVTEGVVNTVNTDGTTTVVPFSIPTGVLVYKADKDRAVADQATNAYYFPNVVPSLNSATCLGASASGDSKPVLAINQKDLIAFKKRIACQKNHVIGGECGLCVNPSVYSYVPTDADINPLTLVVWGYGLVTVTLRGQILQAADAPGADASGNLPLVPLSESKPRVYMLGNVQEGSSIEVNVSTNGPAPPFIYGIMITTNSTASSTVDGLYKLALDKFMEIDTASNTFPRYGAPKNFTYKYGDAKPISPYLKQIRPSPRLNRMNLRGAIPVTLVQKDQLASYDCPTSPMMMLQGSAEILSDDPCINPKGQAPGNYSEECLQNAVLSAGCSMDGEWYKNAKEVAGQRSIGSFIAWIKSLVPQSTTHIGIAKGCSGKDISTPCDQYLSGQGATVVPSKACLLYTYTNASEGSRIGRSYTYAGIGNSSLEGRKIQFCTQDGLLNPRTLDGERRLQEKAQGYNGKVGLEAVKAYLSDVYTKAAGNLDANKADKDGGRKDSWNDCFGIKLADPKLGNVRKLASGDVQTKQINTCSIILPPSYTPSQNTMFGTVPMGSGDYTLAFSIKPTSLVGNWANIIRFQSVTAPWGDCCTPGQRSPAIWFFPGALNLHVRIGDLRDGNWGIDTHPLPINQTSSFRLECRGSSVTLTVNDRVYRATQPSSRARSSAMRVFGSDPWYPAAQAFVTGLCYTPL